MHLCRPAPLLGLALTALAGCQSYQSKPLEPERALDAWASRTADDDSLRAFAESLDRSAGAESYDPSDGIQLHECERIALYYNPDLRLARLRAGVEAASAGHAGLWGDPELGFDAIRVTDTGEDPWIVGGSLAITIPISGRLDAERQRSDAALRASLSRVAEEEWETRMSVRRAWYEWSASALRVERSQSLIESIASLAESTDRLAQAGEIPATQAALFEIERVTHARTLDRLRSETEEHEQRLRRLLGISPDAPLALQPSLSPPDTRDVPPNDELVEHHPTMTRLQDEYEVAEKTLLREFRKQYPDLTIGPTYESDQGSSRIGITGGIPLPILNSNKRSIAEARAERELARAAYETALERLISDVAIAQERNRRARLQRATYESEIIPLVDRQLRDTRRLLEIGESDGALLLDSLKRTGRASMELIDSRLEEALAATRLAALVGPEPTTHNNQDSIENEAQP